MRFYYYRLSEVEEMDARQFFILLNEMYKINANERLEEINTILVPHLKKEDAKKIIKNYENITIDLKEKLKVNNDFTQIENLKKQL
jgi:hypothetical protein